MWRPKEADFVTVPKETRLLVSSMRRQKDNTKMNLKRYCAVI
jgi:hypothetical protein